MILALSLLLFLSGISALIFESLWFQLAARAFGSSVLAASIVLTSFMTGLALGSGLAVFKSDRILNPLRLFAALEIIVGLSGLFIVLLFPHITIMCANIFRAYLSAPLLLNVIRLSLAMALMIIPSTAMGITLPIIIKAIYAIRRNFGSVLGLLYGWNTLGAVIGVLWTEIFLIKRLGIRGAGVTAALISTVIGVSAFILSKKIPIAVKSKEPHLNQGDRISYRSRKILMAAFLSGFALLALEVIWFRFMTLFFMNSSLNFAIMLAVVLAGVSFGGLAASRWFSATEDADRRLVLFPALNVIFICLLYGSFHAVLNFISRISGINYTLISSFYLMFPVSFISGIIYVILGHALHDEMRHEVKAGGLLALSNTIGAAAGSLIAGFLFIPKIGIEGSFAVVAGIYLFIILLNVAKPIDVKSNIFKTTQKTVLVGCLITLALFPRGLMDNVLSKWPITLFTDIGAKRVAVREGINETIQYTRQDLLGKPYYYRLVTNSSRMSGTMLKARRYMKYFAYLPLALQKAPRKALLIGYGVGTTAKALTDNRDLEEIHIVDISEDIVNMSNVVFPDANEDPTKDPRVSIHIEDGRFFLMTTRMKFDIITAEPPPPKNAGIVNLYSEEYFRLIYESLSDGGMTTYWLPMHLLEDAEAKAIMRAFSNVFEGASLWTGGAYDWVMLGIKNPKTRVTEREFSRMWRDPLIREELRALGFTSPDEFGSFFIADGDRLEEWIGSEPPLTDDYPKRLSYKTPSRDEYTVKLSDIMDPVDSGENFRTSQFIDRIWPRALRDRAQRYFKANRIICDIFVLKRPVMANLHRCLSDPLQRKYVLWVLFSDEYAQRILAERLKEGVALSEEDRIDAYRHLAAGAVEDGDYRKAAEYYEFLGKREEFSEYYLYMRMYLYYAAGDPGLAEKIASEFVNSRKVDKKDKAAKIASYVNWLSRIMEKEI